MTHTSSARIVFFGTDIFAVQVLEELHRTGITPALIVTTPDTPQGRGQTLQPSAVSLWAREHSISTTTPHTLNTAFIAELKAHQWDLFLVASYGKILPPDLISIPHHATLNIHPSLLPRLRGASPIESAILYEEETGVTIIEIDEQMDHGPIVAQQSVPIDPWPPQKELLEHTLAQAGARLFASVMPDWIEGTLTAREQDHSSATVSKKIVKEDAHIDLTDDPEVNLRKIRAFHEWPRAYTFGTHKGAPVRVIITEAQITDGTLEITRIIPEGKKEMSYAEFLNGGYLLTPHT